MTEYRKPRYASPLVPILERMVAESGLSHKEICSRVGVNHDTLTRWRGGYAPRIDLLEACFNFFGHSLVAVQGDGEAERRRVMRCRWDISRLEVGNGLTFPYHPGVSKSAYLQAANRDWKVTCSREDGWVIVRRIA